jgi:polysaccharide deacetylase 2 family uncharacterized protein YibQ
MKSRQRILGLYFFHRIFFVFLVIFLQGCQFPGPDLKTESPVPSPLPKENFSKPKFENEKLDFGPWGKFITKKKNQTVYFKIPSGASFHGQIERLKNRCKRQKYEGVHETWKRSRTPQRVVLEFQKKGKSLKLDVRQKISGRIVLVIDDVGHNRKWLMLLQNIDRPMTLAVLPYLPYSKQMARLQGEHFEVILHLPMENLSGLDPGPGAILTGMTDEEIRQKVNEAVESVPGIVGANNHMGSKATADERVMGIVLEELRQKGLIFLDSLTGASAGPRVAREKQILIRSRDVFLDDESDLEYIQNQLVKVKKIAARRGEAIGIGHFKENTLLAIRGIVSEFEDEGFQFVFLSAFYLSGQSLPDEEAQS